MAFDLGWDLRGNLGYRTDPAFGVFLAYTDAYPTTYTNGNGDSINAGWTGSMTAGLDRSKTNDARLGGINYGSSPTQFRVDLASGSNPGAGDYAIDLAAGDAQGGVLTYSDINVKDTSTSVIA